MKFQKRSLGRLIGMSLFVSTEACLSWVSPDIELWMSTIGADGGWSYDAENGLVSIRPNDSAGIVYAKTGLPDVPAIDGFPEAEIRTRVRTDFLDGSFAGVVIWSDSGAFAFWGVDDSGATQFRCFDSTHPWQIIDIPSTDPAAIDLEAPQGGVEQTVAFGMQYRDQTIYLLESNEDGVLVPVDQYDLDLDHDGTYFAGISVDPGAGSLAIFSSPEASPVFEPLELDGDLTQGIDTSADLVDLFKTDPNDSWYYNHRATGSKVMPGEGILALEFTTVDTPMGIGLNDTSRDLGGTNYKNFDMAFREQWGTDLEVQLDRNDNEQEDYDGVFSVGTKYLLVRERTGARFYEEGATQNLEFPAGTIEDFWPVPLRPQAFIYYHDTKFQHVELSGVYTDEDEDDLPDSWEMTYFGDDSAQRDDDLDWDGASNLVEFLARTDPLTPDYDSSFLEPIDWPTDNVYITATDLDDPDGSTLEKKAGTGNTTWRSITAVESIPRDGVVTFRCVSTDDPVEVGFVMVSTNDVFQFRLRWGTVLAIQQPGTGSVDVGTYAVGHEFAIQRIDDVLYFWQNETLIDNIELSTANAESSMNVRARILEETKKIEGLRYAGAFLDADANQIPDDWETHFGVTDLQVDVDGDEIFPLEEFRNGTDPDDPYNGVPPTLVVSQGNHQQGLPDEILPVPLEVEVIEGGNGQAPSNVVFTILEGAAELTFDPATAGSTDPLTVQVSGDFASVYLKMPSASEEVRVRAVFENFEDETGVIFWAKPSVSELPTFAPVEFEVLDGPVTINGTPPACLKPLFGTLLTKTTTSAWDNKSRSTSTLYGDGEIRFRFPNAEKVAIGFNAYAGDGQGSINNLDYAFYARDGIIYILDTNNGWSGESTSFSLGTYDCDDTFAIKREGTDVSFHRNGWKIFTSADPSSEPLQVEARLHDVSTKVGNIVQAGMVEEFTVGSGEALVEFWVDAAGGDDDNSGASASRAFATIRRAQEAVRQQFLIDGSNPTPPSIRVNVTGRHYLNNEALVFDEEDSSSSQSVEWVGHGEAWVIGGEQVSSWEAAGSPFPSGAYVVPWTGPGTPGLLLVNDEIRQTARYDANYRDADPNKMRLVKFVERKTGVTPNSDREICSTKYSGGAFTTDRVSWEDLVLSDLDKTPNPDTLVSSGCELVEISRNNGEIRVRIFDVNEVLAVDKTEPELTPGPALDALLDLLNEDPFNISSLDSTERAAAIQNAGIASGYDAQMDIGTDYHVIGLTYDDQNLDQAQVGDRIFFASQWVEEFAVVDEIDTVADWIVFEEEPHYRPRSGNLNSAFYLEAVNSAPDYLSEGEWWYDEVGEQLYYYPKSGKVMASLTVTAVSVVKPVRLEGASNLRFSGITFCGGSWEHEGNFNKRNDIGGLRYTGDLSYGIVDVSEGSDDIVFRNCVFRGGKMRGLSLSSGTLPCSKVIVDGCEVFDCSAGIRVGRTNSGADNQSGVQVEDCQIVNSSIHDLGAVFIHGTGVEIGNADGTIVSNCHFRDVQTSGIHVGGFFNKSQTVRYTSRTFIRENHLEELGSLFLLLDTGAIHTNGYQAFDDVGVGDSDYGLEIVGNYIHDCYTYGTIGGFGIYLDEDSGNIKIADNLIQRMGWSNVAKNAVIRGSSELLVKGEQNLFEDNIVIGKLSLSADSRFLGLQSLIEGKEEGEAIDVEEKVVFRHNWFLLDSKYIIATQGTSVVQRDRVEFTDNQYLNLTTTPVASWRFDSGNDITQALWIVDDTNPAYVAQDDDSYFEGGTDLQIQSPLDFVLDRIASE